MDGFDGGYEVRFKHLSLGLKIAIVGGWLSIISFSIGFIMGFLGI